jgi:hypothetical protein
MQFGPDFHFALKPIQIINKFKKNIPTKGSNGQIGQTGEKGEIGSPGPEG